MQDVIKTITGAILSLLLLLSLWSPGTAAEQNKETVITAGPSWDGFTNKDGTGLYHDIIQEIFTDSQIKHFYVSTVQANNMVAIGRADIKMCETEEIQPLMMSSHPMYENNFYVVFLKNRIGKWNGKESLADHSVVWKDGYYSQADFPVQVKAVPVRSGESALNMLIHGRVDYYVDDMNLIRQSFKNSGETLDTSRYGIERVGVRKYFPVFARTERGKDLRKRCEQGMERLYEEGILQALYTKYNFPVPDFDFAQSKQ